MKIILQPCGSVTAQKHYQNTIDGMKTSVDNLKKYLTEEEYNDLLSIYPNKNCMIWGITNVNINKWKRIDTGDVVLFCGNGRIFSSATVTYKILNKELAKYLWGAGEDDNTWECIYFIDELKKQDILYSNFNTIIGYKVNYVIRGFSILDEAKSHKFINIYNLDSDRYFSNTISYNEYTKTIDEEEKFKKLNSEKNLDSNTNSTRRLEQAFLRKHLFKNKYVGTCSICGREFPVEFLWCSHIKKRELCTREEKLDYKNIVTPMCKFGCDDLYEKKYIGVKDGFVKILKYSNTKYIDDYLKNLNNKACLDYNAQNKKYYDSHLQIK